MCDPEICPKAEGLGRICTLASMSMVPGCGLLVAARACLSTDSRGVVPSSLLVSLNPAASAPPTTTCRTSTQSVCCLVQCGKTCSQSRILLRGPHWLLKDGAALLRGFWRHTVRIGGLFECQALQPDCEGGSSLQYTSRQSCNRHAEGCQGPLSYACAIVRLCRHSFCALGGG